MRNREARTVGLCLAAVAVVLALGIVGKMDAEDAERQHAHTCSMVASGAWPEEVGRGCDDTRP